MVTDHDGERRGVHDDVKDVAQNSDEERPPRRPVEPQQSRRGHAGPEHHRPRESVRHLFLIIYIYT